MGLLGDYSAANLSPSGRAFFVSDDGRMEAQTPYITNEEVTATVEAAASGQVKETAKPRRHSVSERDVFEWALRKNDGKLGWRDIYAEFAPRKLTSHEAKRFGRDFAGQVVTVLDRQYRIEPATGVPNPKPARLLPVLNGDAGPVPRTNGHHHNGNGRLHASGIAEDFSKDAGRGAIVLHLAADHDFGAPAAGAHEDGDSGETPSAE